MIILLIIIVYILFESIYVYLTINDEKGVDIRIGIFFGLLKININVLKNLSKFTSSKYDREEGDVFNYTEIIENVRKFIKARNFFKEFLLYLKIHKLKWHTTFGVDDAAETAMISGYIWVVKNSLLFLFKYSRFKQKPDLKVIPKYNDSTLDVDVGCIFSIRIVHIITVLIKFRRHIRMLIKRVS